MTRPAKPYPDFPLFAHATGRWAKKIKGKLHYFGSCNDGWEKALEKYTAERDYLHAGKRPPVNPDGLKVRDLCNHFLTQKQQLVDAGEITRRTFHEYRQACERIIVAFGADRLVSDIDAGDFGAFRAALAKGVGPVRLGNYVRLVRIAFKFGYDNGLMDKPARFGQNFNMPAMKEIRKARNAAGPRVFTADEIRKLLEGASVQMQAMILLGINCGMGNQDVSDLPISALDLEAGLLDFPRPKTSIDRRATLWPETVKALRAAIDARPTPSNKADATLVFITKYGAPWVRFSDANATTDSVGLEFGKLRRKLGIDRKGVGFYTLRRCFETIGGETGDQAAVDRIMGHSDPSMAAVYRQWSRDERENERLRRVTDHVHGWLCGPPKPVKGKTRSKAPAKRRTRQKADTPGLRLVG